MVCFTVIVFVHAQPKQLHADLTKNCRVADHDLDDLPSLSEAQIDIYVARGILIESKEATWLYATSSEHSVLYQYQLNRASNVFMGLVRSLPIRRSNLAADHGVVTTDPN